MMKFIEPGIAYLRDLARDAVALWNRVWFTPADPINVAAIRIVTGLILIHTHLSTLPDLLDFIGPHAWIDAQGLTELHRLPRAVADFDEPSWRGGEQSVWFHVQDARLIWILHALFLVAVVCLTLGLFSRTASVIAWAGHLSYVQRGVVITYGLDTILAMLMLYLIFAPIGGTLSLDRWRRRRRLTAVAPLDDRDTQKSVAANVVLRFIQFHLCLIYLFSGLSKVAGAAWWNGTAVYSALMIPEATLFDMGWMAQSDWLWLLLSNIGCFATVALELGFPILVWHPRLRPLMLAAAVIMQIGLGLLLSLGAFQAAMFAALIAFLPPRALRNFLAILSRRARQSR